MTQKNTKNPIGSPWYQGAGIKKFKPLVPPPPVTKKEPAKDFAFSEDERKSLADCLSAELNWEPDWGCTKDLIDVIEQWSKDNAHD